MKPRILVVDNDSSWVQLVSTILRADYEVSSAPSAAEALQACWAGKPRLILCDMGVAHTPGIDMLKRLQADPQYAGISVLLTTDNPKLAKQAPQAGMKRLLVKPCPQKELQEAVRDALAGSGSNVSAAEAPAGARQFKVLVADDQGNFLQFLDIVIRQLVSHDRNIVYHKAKDGRQALDLAREHCPDLVISDMMMPGLTGVEFMREMGKDARLKAVPCILMTANRMPAQQKDVLLQDIPALKYILEKPCSIEALRAAIEALLEEA